MKSIFIITLIVFTVGCQNSEQPLIDHTSHVFGQVKSEDGILIDSCIVGFLVPDADSSLLINDSIFVQYGEILAYSTEGKYQINWFLSPVPLPYNRMYAFKEGFKLWHYKSESDKIVKVKTYIDSLNITLRE